MVLTQMFGIGYTEMALGTFGLKAELLRSGNYSSDFWGLSAVQRDFLLLQFVGLFFGFLFGLVWLVGFFCFVVCGFFFFKHPGILPVINRNGSDCAELCSEIRGLLVLVYFVWNSYPERVSVFSLCACRSGSLGNVSH